MCNIASIIVTYNGEKWIRQCLDSLFSSNLKTDIYIIDNGSTDGTLNIIKNYPEIKVTQSNENLGFGKANNLLLKKTFHSGNYDYFFLINQDAWVKPDCIGQLVDFMKNNQEYGIVSPVHYNKNFSEIDFNFSEYLNKTKLNSGKEIISVPFVNAAIWLLSRKCLEKVGLFNPYFNHYGEDKNYCNRAEYKKLKIGVLINAQANHDRERVIDFQKIIRLSKIKLESILLNPNDTLYTAYTKALKNVVGIPKYYVKTLFKKEGTQLFFQLLKHYIKLLVSTEIRENRKKQKNDAFLIKLN